MPSAPRTWWRLVHWRAVAAAGLPVWAAVAGAITWHRTHPEPDPVPTPRIEPAAVAVVPVAPSITPEPPPPATGSPFGPLLWAQLTTAAAGADRHPGQPAAHPFFPAPDPVWAAVVEGQVRTANRMLADAKLAGLPVAGTVKPVAKPRPGAKAEPPIEIDGCKTFDTFVAWRPSPQEAMRRAAADDKLVFLLHLAGNLEDDGFT